jgi:hypothetical protein
MRKDILARLAKLETKLGKGNAKEVNTKQGRGLAVLHIIAFHSNFSHESLGDPHESLGDAIARGLGMTTPDLKSALRSNPADLWALALEKLDALVTARGGRPIGGVCEARPCRARRDEDQGERTA